MNSIKSNTDNSNSKLDFILALYRDWYIPAYRANEQAKAYLLNYTPAYFRAKLLAQAMANNGCIVHDNISYELRYLNEAAIDWPQVKKIAISYRRSLVSGLNIAIALVKPIY